MTQSWLQKKLEEFDERFIHYSDFGHSFKDEIEPNGSCRIKQFISSLLQDFAKEVRPEEKEIGHNGQYGHPETDAKTGYNAAIADFDSSVKELLQ